MSGDIRRLFDSHTHLDFSQFDSDREELLAEMRRQRVAALNVGLDLETSRASLELARAHPHLFAACGFHPHEAKHFSPQAAEQLEALLAEAVAVGEIGLDYYRNLSPRGVQLGVFKAQLRLARRLDLPVVLHQRAAEEDFFALLAEEAPLRGVLHAFSGGPAQAHRAVALGLHLGIGGPLTYPKNQALRAAVREVPRERLLLETDSPFLPPQPFRGKRNDPLKVRLVASQLAEILGMPAGELAELCWENTCRLFHLHPPF